MAEASFFSVKVSLTMAGTRLRSPLPATSARSLTIEAPPEPFRRAFTASWTWAESNPLLLSGETWNAIRFVSAVTLAGGSLGISSVWVISSGFFFFATRGMAAAASAMMAPSSLKRFIGFRLKL